MATTARDLCILALKECGVIGVGQVPLAEDINDSFTLLSRMLAIWQRKRWLIPALMDIYAVGNGQRSNKIGPGQYYNHPRPSDIKSAYVKQINTAGLKVDIPLRLIKSYEDYSRISVKDLNSLPNYLFYDAASPYGNVYAWPIPNELYEVHLIVQTFIGFNTGINSLSISNVGTGYADGIYLQVPLLNISNLNNNRSGYGEDATVNISIVAGNIVTFEVANPGSGYSLNNNLTLNNLYMGGVGSGFIANVTSTIGSVDTLFTMEPEYEEAIHYNLAVRLCSMYQLSPQPSTITLAKLALNAIKNANTQVPTMTMPVTLAQPRAYNIYSDYGY